MLLCFLFTNPETARYAPGVVLTRPLGQLFQVLPDEMLLLHPVKKPMCKWSTIRIMCIRIPVRRYHEVAVFTASWALSVVCAVHATYWSHFAAWPPGGDTRVTKDVVTSCQDTKFMTFSQHRAQAYSTCVFRDQFFGRTILKWKKWRFSIYPIQLWMSCENLHSSPNKHLLVMKNLQIWLARPLLALNVDVKVVVCFCLLL